MASAGYRSPMIIAGKRFERVIIIDISTRRKAIACRLQRGAPSNGNENVTINKLSLIESVAPVQRFSLPSLSLSSPHFEQLLARIGRHFNLFARKSKSISFIVASERSRAFKREPRYTKEWRRPADIKANTNMAGHVRFERPRILIMMAKFTLQIQGRKNRLKLDESRRSRSVFSFFFLISIYVYLFV